MVQYDNLIDTWNARLIELGNRRDNVLRLHIASRVIVVENKQDPRMAAARATASGRAGTPAPPSAIYTTRGVEQHGS